MALGYMRLRLVSNHSPRTTFRTASLLTPNFWAVCLTVPSSA